MPRRNVSQTILITILLVGMGLTTFFLVSSLMETFGAPLEPTPAIEGITALNPPTQISDFALTRSTGETFRLADLGAKPTLLFFGYTSCPDFCPTTLTKFQRIHAMLGADADRLNMVFVSVDGTRDTPAVVGRYLENLGVAAFVVGLTGTEQEVRTMGGDFSLFFEKGAPVPAGNPTPGSPHSSHTTQAGYLVDHTTLTYLIDQEGALRFVYSYSTPFDAIVGHLRAFL